MGKFKNPFFLGWERETAGKAAGTTMTDALEGSLGHFTSGTASLAGGGVLRVKA